jgi:glycosyltransferase involved in cell wall biosynthesis
MSEIRAIALYGSEDASTLWRVWSPYTALQRRGYIADFAPKDSDGIALAFAARNYNVLVLPRLSWPLGALEVAREWIGRFRDRGILTVYECDDDSFLHISEHLTAAEDADRLATNLQSVETMRLCDAVTVSTPRLATLVRTLTPAPVAVVPNLLDIAWFDAILYRAKRTVPGLTIGWAGAKRQEDDFAPVAEAWRRLALRYPDVRFVVAGWQPDALRGAVPSDRLHTLPWLPLQRYPELYRQIDIMCCPLADTPFNRCKTPIKAMEAGAAGCAVVASPTLYRSIVKDNDTGYLARDADEWETHLARLVEDGELRKVLARRLRRRVVEEHDLGQNAERWIAAWIWLRERAQERRAA